MRNLGLPGHPSVTCPKEAIQTQTRRTTAATQDSLQAQKAGSKVSCGCLGDSLINSHTAQLRLHSNPHARGRACARARPCQQLSAASAKLPLKTCTQVTRVCIHRRQTNVEAHSPLLVMGPGRDIQRLKGQWWKSPWCSGAPERGQRAQHATWRVGWRQTSPLTAEASGPQILGKEPECDSEG